MTSAQVSNGLGRHDSELEPKEHFELLKVRPSCSDRLPHIIPAPCQPVSLLTSTPGFLGNSLDIQPRTLVHQSFDLGSIPADFSGTPLPESVLCRPPHRGGVRYLDCLWQHLPLQSNQNLLGAIHAGCGMHGPQDRVVHERRCQHRSRHRHPPSTDAFDPDSPGISGPEARSGDYVRTWGYVSSTRHLATLHVS